MKKWIFLALMILCEHNAYCWAWMTPYIVKSVNYENATKQIQFSISNPSNASDPNLSLTFIYDCDQPGNSFEEGKIVQSMLLTAMSTKQKVGFDTQNISGSTTVYEIRQFKIIGN